MLPNATPESLPNSKFVFFVGRFPGPTADGRGGGHGSDENDNGPTANKRARPSLLSAMQNKDKNWLSRLLNSGNSTSRNRLMREMVREFRESQLNAARERRDDAVVADSDAEAGELRLLRWKYLDNCCRLDVHKEESDDDNEDNDDVGGVGDEAVGEETVEAEDGVETP